MNHVKLSMRHLLSLIGLYLLGLILPRRGKRIILLTTLHARLVRDGVFHEETMCKLNASLHLASSEKALALPASIYGSVWSAEQLKAIMKEIDGNYDGETCLLYSDARRVGESIIELTPRWLKYDNPDEMLNDVLSLFYCKPARIA